MLTFVGVGEDVLRLMTIRTRNKIIGEGGGGSGKVRRQLMK